MNTALVVEISRRRKGAEEPIHGTQAFDTGLLLLTEIAPTTSEVTRLTNVRCWLLQLNRIHESALTTGPQVHRDP